MCHNSLVEPRCIQNFEATAGTSADTAYWRSQSLTLACSKRCLRVDDPTSHHFMLFKPRTSFRNSRGCAKSHNLCSLHEQASYTTYVSTPSVCPRVCCTQSRHAIDNSCMFWRSAVRNNFHLSVNLHRQCQQGLRVKAGSPCAALATDVAQAHCFTESPPSFIPTKCIANIHLQHTVALITRVNLDHEKDVTHTHNIFVERKTMCRECADSFSADLGVILPFGWCLL